jgi:putative peptide zinc metalloprotease protein
VWLAAFSIFLAFVVTLSSWGEIGRALPRLLRLDTLVWAWLAIVLIGAAHELAHGLTCKRFGGRVNDMGLLLLYFQPALYCDVSDAWLFAEKSKRLWVTFAGPFFELLLWSFATLVWRVTEPASWVNRAALIVWATSGFKVFLDLNPLIKLDGYYLLSDYLEFPNLRARSFAYLRALVRSGPSDPAVGARTPRERRICVAYGSLAGIFSVGLLSLTLLGLGSSLVGALQGAGFVLFVAFLLLVSRGRIRTAARSVGAKLRAAPAPEPATRDPRRARLVKLAVLASLVAALFLVRMELRVSGPFEILPTYTATVQAEIDGVVDEVLVDQGAVVKAGELIARLSNREHLAEFRKVEAAIEEKNARLRILTAGPRPEEITLAKIRVENAKTTQEQLGHRYDEAQRIRSAQLVQATAAVRKAEEQLRYARNDRDRFATLFDAGVASRKQREAAEEQLAVRQAELTEVRAAAEIVNADNLASIRKESALAAEWLREAQAGLDLLLAGSRPEEIEAARAEIESLEAQRRYLERQLELVEVHSPISGVVVTPRPKEKAGHYLRKGDVIAEVQDLENLRIEISVSEKDIGEVAVEQPVSLKARAHSRQAFEARVVSIAPAASGDGVTDEEKAVLVTTQVADAFPFLRPEMTGMAKIDCGRRSLFEILTRRLARYVRVEFWSWW